MESTNLKEQTTAMLQSLIATATETGEFIKEQVPLVIKELLAFNTAVYVLGLAAGLVGVVAAAFWCRFAVGKYQAHIAAGERSYSTSWDVAAMIPTAVVGFFSLAAVGVNLYNLMKITLAPRVWLIEYAAGLVK